MKKLKAWRKKWWFSYVVLPYIRKNKVQCCQELRDAIVFQMRHGKVGYTHINKWLLTIGMPKIYGYRLEDNGNCRLFYSEPTAEQRAEHKNPITLIN